MMNPPADPRKPLDTAAEREWLIHWGEGLMPDTQTRLHSWLTEVERLRTELEDALRRDLGLTLAERDAAITARYEADAQ